MKVSSVLSGTASSNGMQSCYVSGGTGWTPEASRDLANFVQAYNFPVAASFRRQDFFDNRDAHYVGQLCLGTSSGPGQTLVHLHVDLAELNRVFVANLSINTSMPAAASAVASLKPQAELVWNDWTAAARADYMVHSTPQAPTNGVMGYGLSAAIAAKMHAQVYGLVS